LHPETIQRIARLDLRARTIVEGFMSGQHRSPYFGQSIEFRQHREYAPGDDLRHVDWKVWARQDRLYVKQFEEDTNLRCYLLLDGSRSMSYRSGIVHKFDYASTLACCLAHLLLRQQDAVGCLLFDQTVRRQVPCRKRQDQLQTIAEALSRESPREKTDLYPVLLQAAESFPRRGMMILFTDAFAARDRLFQGLRLLKRRGHDLMLFHVLDEAEIEFSFPGPTRFDDLESEEHLACNPRALREAYLRAFEAFLHEVRHGCARLGIEYTLLRTSQPLEAALVGILARRRMRRTGRR
jgi:uncharacterized protein (DUF58 family)